MDLLKILRKLTPSERQHIISRLNQKSVDDLSTFIMNVIKCDFNYKPSTKKKLKRDLKCNAKDLRYIADATKPWKKRQLKLVKQGQSGSGLGVVLASTLPLLINYITKSLSK